MIPDGKSGLRPRLRALRIAVAADRGAMVPVPPGFAALARDQVVAGYVAVAGEADPAALLAAAAAAGATVLLPHLSARDAAMRFVPAGPLRPGPRGILQPDAAPAPAPQLVLAPLLGFDAAGHRLGQGGGHYDRALASLPDALVIGVAFAAQRVDRLPTDPWDRPLAGVITEHGLAWFEGATA